MPQQPFSFLPEDTITPAIQNLGHTLGAINQAKTKRQEDLLGKFQSLMDISTEGLLAQHQDEVMKDYDEFRNKAVDYFK